MRRLAAGAAQILCAQHILDDANEHADSGDPKAEMPIDPLPDPTADQRRDECAEVDPHVEDRKTGVAAMIVERVEHADYGADVWLEQAGPEDEQDQPGVETHSAGGNEAKLARGNQDAAVKHGAPGTQ